MKRDLEKLSRDNFVERIIHSKRMEILRSEISRIEAVFQELGISNYQVYCDKFEDNHLEFPFGEMEEFHRYLNVNKDIYLALTEAKAELKNFKGEKSQFEVFFAKDWAKSFVIPVLLIITTAIAGNFLGNALQNSSFIKQRGFEAKLSELKDGRKNAIELSKKGRKLFLNIGNVEFKYYDRYNESGVDLRNLKHQRDKQLLRYRNEIRETILDEIKSIEISAKGQNYKPYKEIEKSASELYNKVDTTIKCLLSVNSNSPSNCTGFGSSKAGELNELNEFEESFSKLISQFNSAIEYLYKNG